MDDRIIKSIIIFSIVIVAILIVRYIIPKAHAKKMKKEGKKTSGYIFDVECWNRYDHFTTFIGAVKVYVDGKIKRIDRILVDDKYKRLYNKINSQYTIDKDISVKGIPVDVYINEDEVYVDLESAEV